MGACPAENLLEDLITLECRGWRSLCDGTGSQFCREVVAEDALMELDNGVILDRVALEQTVLRAPRWSGYEIVGAHLVSVAARAAALEYIGSGFIDGDRAFVGAVSSLYRRSGAGWKLVLCRQTG
jgi:hypothetical protein